MTGDRLIVTAKPAPKLWAEYKSVGFAVAEEDYDSTDVSCIEFLGRNNSLNIGVVYNDGIFISEVLPDGDAAADGRLRVGDEIVFVGEQSSSLIDAGIQIYVF